MLKVGICDDENVIANQMEKMLSQTCNEFDIRVDIDVFYFGEELEREILNGEQYDLLYLDIQMEDKDGIITAKNIRKMDENVLIIYVSGFDKYLRELFRLDVFDFIKKPINFQKFSKIFLAAYDKICSKKIYFSYHYKSIEHKFQCSEILYFQSVARQIEIHLKNGDIEIFNEKLNDIEENLKNGKTPFLRIHQSYLVNYNLIKARTKVKIEMINGKELYISAERQKTFNQEYGKLLRGEIIE